MLIRRLVALALLASAPVAAPAHAMADPTDWVLLGVDFDDAHKVTRGEGVTIAILSTGATTDVDGLRKALHEERNLARTSRPDRTFGTLYASLIVSRPRLGSDPVGSRGLAPEARILPVRIMPDREERDADNWYEDNDNLAVTTEGIRYAVDKGAQVILVDEQFHGPGSEFDGLRAAVAHAQSRNAVVVAASNFQRSFPAALPGVIGVGVLDEKRKAIPRPSDRDGSVIVSGPGYKIPAVGPGNELWEVRGGSVAASFVAAAAALVKAEYPDLTPAQVRQALVESARHPKGRGEYDTSVGFGIVNPADALKQAARLAPALPVAATAGSVPEREPFGDPDKASANRSPAALAGFGGLIAVGVLALAGAMILFRRRRPVPSSGDGGR